MLQLQLNVTRGCSLYCNTMLVAVSRRDCEVTVGVNFSNMSFKTIQSFPEIEVGEKSSHRCSRERGLREMRCDACKHLRKFLLK